MMFRAYEKSFDRILIWLGGLLVVCVGIAVGFGTRSPDIEPVTPPRDLLLLSAEVPLLPMTEVSDDFVSRPLFEESRQPPTPQEVVVPEKTEVEPIADGIDDTTLAGVFASGDVKGVIVLSGKGRERLLVGEEFKGWTLIAVESRSATFVTGKGRKKRQAKLDMTVTSSLSPAELAAISIPTPEEGYASGPMTAGGQQSQLKRGPRGRNSEMRVRRNPGSGAEDGKKATGSVQGMLTFDKMYGEESPKDGDDNNGN